jgi:hypothetical protein
MFHLSAFYVNAAASTTAFQQAIAVQDQALPPFNNNVMIPPTLNKLLGGFAYGATIGRAQLQSPSLRIPAQMDISEISSTLVTLQNQPRMKLYMAGMPTLAPGEQVSAFTVNTAGATDNEIVAIWLADKVPTATTSEFRTIRATAATTLVPLTWSNTGTLLFEQTLPPGKYNVLGARVQSATGVLFRLVFPGYPWRPGALANTDAFGIDNLWTRYGVLGPWGTFDTTTFFTVDIMATAADVAEVIEVDVAPATT